DLAMARNVASGDESWAVVADQGPAPHPLGEVSLALAEALGGKDPDPRNGTGIPAGPYQYMVFPGSRLDPPWPQAADALRRRAEALFAGVGGWPSA
ncbi:MAG: hypothetical protein LC656_07190, partial [Sphingomonadales bacterium]|nr:hypothetical protein [Sphingomonadales bacterium]